MLAVLGQRSLSLTRSNIMRLYSTKLSTGCPLVLTPAQLSDMMMARTASTDLVVLDASWHMPTSPRKAHAEYLSTRIPSARFLDLDQVASNHPLSLSHMMPDARTFAHACSRLGIMPSTHVVIYDSHGVFSSPRALYMFRTFGHHRSSILDGGLLGWQAHGAPVEGGKPDAVQAGCYAPPVLDTEAVKDYDQIVLNSKRDPQTDHTAFYLLDARSHPRFLGTDPEPRRGIPSGHVPYAISLPFDVFLEKHTMPVSEEVGDEDAPTVTYTRLRSAESMLDSFQAAVGTERAQEILEGKREVVTSCGSGMTAGIIWLGLRLFGVEWVSLYDESWTGYAMRSESTIVTGE